MQATHRKRVQFGFEQERPAKRQRVDAAVTRRAVPSSELEYERAAGDDRRYELTGEVLPASVGVAPSWLETTHATEDETSTPTTSEGNTTASVAMSGMLGAIRLPRSTAPADPRFSAGKRGASQLLKRKSEDSAANTSAQGLEVALIVNLHPQGYSLNDQEQMHAYHRTSTASRDLLASIDHNQLYQPLHQLVAQLQPKYDHGALLVQIRDFRGPVLSAADRKWSDEVTAEAVPNKESAEEHKDEVKSEVKDEHAANNSSANNSNTPNTSAPTPNSVPTPNSAPAEESESAKSEDKKESRAVTPVTLKHPITCLHPRHSPHSRGLPAVHHVLLRPSYEHVIGDVRQLIDRLVAESASKASKLHDSSAALDESVDLDSMIESFINRDETAASNSAADTSPGLRVESKSDATNLLEAKLFRALVPDLCLDPSTEVLFRNNSAHYNARKMLRAVPHRDLKRARVVPRVVSTARAIGVSPASENEHVMQVEATTEPTPLSVENGHSVNEPADDSAASTQVDTMTPVNVTLEPDTVATSSRKRESKLLNFLQTISHEALVEENDRYLHRASIYQPLSIITNTKSAASALPSVGSELCFAHSNKMKQAQEQSRTLKYGINKSRDYLQLELAFAHQGSDHVHLRSEEHDPRWTGKLLVLKDVVPGKPLPARDPRYEVEFSIGDQYQTQLFVNTLNQIEMQQAGTQLIQDSAVGYQAHPNVPQNMPYMPQGQPPGPGQPGPGGPVKLPFMGPGGAVPPPGMIKRPDQPMNMMPGPGGMPKLPPQMNVVPPGGLAQNPMLMQRRQGVPPPGRPGAPMPQNIPGQPYMPPNQQFPPNFPHHQ